MGWQTHVAQEETVTKRLTMAKRCTHETRPRGTLTRHVWEMELAWPCGIRRPGALKVVVKLVAISRSSRAHTTLTTDAGQWTPASNHVNRSGAHRTTDCTANRKLYSAHSNEEQLDGKTRSRRSSLHLRHMFGPREIPTMSASGANDK